MKNLTADIYCDIKNILKATSAWILLIYAGDGAKLLSTVIRIFSITGRNLLHGVKTEENSLKCSSSAIELWHASNIASLQQFLPPIELEDIKIAIFQVLSIIMIIIVNFLI